MEPVFGLLFGALNPFWLRRAFFGGEDVVAISACDYPDSPIRTGGEKGWARQLREDDRTHVPPLI